MKLFRQHFDYEQLQNTFQKYENTLNAGHLSTKQPFQINKKYLCNFLPWKKFWKTSIFNLQNNYNIFKYIIFENKNQHFSPFFTFYWKNKWQSSVHISTANQKIALSRLSPSLVILLNSDVLPANWPEFCPPSLSCIHTLCKFVDDVCY